MKDVYSLYEAKAKFSALVRQVREGRAVTITVHGKPVVELRPYQPPQGPPTLAERIEELKALGEIIPVEPSTDVRGAFPVGPALPGALQRFLDERD